MKKTIYTIIAALVALTSCQKELSGPQNEHPGRYAEGRATIHFKVSTDASTKAGAFADEAKVNTLRLVVFDEEGFVSEVVPATLDETGKKSGEYVATLALSYEHRTIHFIANYTGTIPFGTAEDAIATLYTSDKYDAYWQMVDMPDGITVMADNNGDPILDSGNNMVFDDSVISALDNIVLIRNYAKFTITSASGSNLQIESACVVGTANQGAVAPYNREKSDFVTNYANYDYPADLIAALEYNGCIPESAVPTTITDAVWADVESGACTIYSYERELPLSNPPFILVKGKYGTTAAERSAASSTYYKINLRDSAENYFPILRNYNYKINIKNVAKAGEATIQEAIDGPGSGDISTDINFLDLTNISNGEARIFVSFTDKVLVSGNAIQLKYKFIPDMTDPNTTANGDVTITKGESGYFGPIFPATGNTDVVITSNEDGDHYRIVTLDPRDPDQYNRTQTLTLTGHYTDKNGEAATISRIISFTLREKPEIILSCAATVAKTANTALPLAIKIPGGLSQSMFPLDMMIEAEKGTLSPSTSTSITEAEKNLPVRYGTSLFDSSRPGYYFIRQITWSEYEAATLTDGYKSFNAAFVTTAAASATAIKVRNDYFIDGNTYFKNTGDPDGFHLLKFEDNLKYGATGVSTDFSFFMTSTPTVTVTITNGKKGTSTTYTHIPTQAGLQTISGIVPDTKGTAVTVSLTADGYTQQSLDKYWYATIPAGTSSLGTFCPDGTDFGGDSEGTKTSEGIVYAGLNTTTALAEVPVNVTRTGTMTAVPAPVISNARSTRSGGSGERKYAFNFTIDNFDSSKYQYYWSTSDSATSSKTEITSSNGDIIGAQSSRDVYIWAKHKTSGTFCTTPAHINAPTGSGTQNATITNGNAGVFNYTYSITGPAVATDVEFNSNVSDSNTIYLFYPGKGSLKTYPLSSL